VAELNLLREKKQGTFYMAVCGKVSIAAPAYNEADNIVRVVETWLRYLQSQKRFAEFEIVVCNDGSRDQTGFLLDGIAAVHPQVRPLHLAQNAGAGAAATQAIQATRGDWILVLDSDGQFPIENLDRLAEAIADADGWAATGVRRKKQDSRFARFGTWSSGALVNFFLGTRYQDLNSALKLVQGNLLRGLNLEARGLNYSTEISALLSERGVAMTEVEIEHHPREKGISSRRLIRSTMDRLLFVLYIGVRQLLFKLEVLQRPRS
jgi:dolichol-phosphate mannosyltransferase